MPKQPIGEARRRPPRFYADPQHPGKSRHLECLQKAGVSPKQSGLQQTEGPCWACERATHELTIYQGSLVMFGDIDRVAEKLHQAGCAGFNLTIEARASFGRHLIKRVRLEEKLSALLSQFRETFSTAQKCAWDPSGHNYGDAGMTVQATSILYAITVGNVYGTEFDPRRYLQTDPTAAETVDIAKIEEISGRCMYLARYMNSRASERKGLVLANHGKDLDDCAASLIKQVHASPRLLSESAVSFLTPTGELSAKDLSRARLQEDRWYKRIKRQPNARGKAARRR